MRQRIKSGLLVFFSLYVFTYFLLRISGSINGHVAQGYFELEFGDGGVLTFLPPKTAVPVLLSFWPLMWLEQPFLKFYVAEPTGG